MPQPVVLLKSHLENTGGLEKVTRRLARAFVEEGHPVTLLTTGEPQGVPDGIDLQILGPRSKSSCKHWKEYDGWVRQWLKKNPSEIIFGMDRTSLQTHHRAGNGVHSEYLLSRSETEGFWKRLSFKINPLHRQLLKLERRTFEGQKLKTLFCNSHLVRSQILKHYKVDPGKIQVVHNGVEWHQFEADFAAWPERREEVRHAFGLDPHAFQFLFLGHGFKRKGLDLLLKSLSRLAHRDFQLSVVGKDKSMHKYQALVEELGLKGKVKFFGPRQGIQSFYQMADCLVVPSLYDPFANVTVEGLAMGLFVVTSEFNGGAEVLNEQTGIVTRDLNHMVSELVFAMDRMKTPASAAFARESVASLEFSHQLRKIVTNVCSETPPLVPQTLA